MLQIKQEKIFNNNIDTENSDHLERGANQSQNPLTCNFCQKTFVHMCNLRVHEMTHTGERPHACGFCKKRFITKSKLSMHGIVHNPNYEKPHACSFCIKKFIYRI